MVGPAGVQSICLYGTDSNEPYLAMSAPGIAGGTSSELRAEYTEVPAGIALRVASVFGTADAAACARAVTDAVALEVGPPAARVDQLTADRYFTAVLVEYDEFFLRDCTSNSGEDYCDWVASPSSSLPSVPCTPKGVVFQEDGFRFRDEYTGGYRITNLTSNASIITAHEEEFRSAPIGNASGGPPVNGSYDVPLSSGDTIRFCPPFVCDASLSSSDASDARTDCAGRDPSREFLRVESSRLGAEDRATTVYILGNIPPVSDGRGGLRSTISSSDAAIVIANDVRDGALP